ncbi:hypothetical protein LTS18_002173 [Coniosporium uncinatum]|uniref:Uncharacterized protein n=1 Tax=Coniosporium uncinatum TaxID=93489 RepID=A0ACC3DEH9_9PEZI|nr:hypothetical protein LTS18_002173 [Coniosporium uncinatum]
MDNLPEPIDLELDHSSTYLYKTDRGAEPRGNTVSRVDLAVFGKGTGIEPVKQAVQSGETEVREEILDEHLHEGIGLALDEREGRMYFTDLGGSVYSAKTDGSDKKEILKGFGGGLTGIAVAHFD